MNVLVVSSSPVIQSIAFQMELDGDEVSIVSSPGDISKFDLVVADKDLGRDVNGPIVTLGGGIPQNVLELLGYEISQDKTSRGIDFLLTKWFSFSSLWGPQTIVGFEIVGMMNQNLGAMVPTGFGLRYVEDDGLGEFFDNDSLVKILREMSFSGFVTFRLRADEKNVLVKDLSFGIPSYGILAVLEGCPGRISDFFCDPSRLQESWAVGVLVSRYPYPVPSPSRRTPVDGLSKGLLKHFYPFGVVRHRKGYVVKGNVLGVVTAWSGRLSEACSRALRSCRNLKCPEIQYRTDLLGALREQWCFLLRNGIVKGPENEQYD